MIRKLLMAALAALIVIQSAAADVTITSFGTDKDIYHLGEKMSIYLVIHSQHDIENVSITVRGMKSRAGSDLISLSRSVNLSAGEKNNI